MDCGAMMIYVDANSKYCDKCRERRRKESEQSFSKIAIARRKKANEKRACKECGKSISDRASNAIYCRECSSMKNTLAAAKRAKELTKKPKVQKQQSKPVENLNHCKGCVHRGRMTGFGCFACEYFLHTGKERPMPPSECYKHKNTPYERVRG